MIERFFKECDEVDYKNIIVIKGIEKDTLKNIYKDSIAARSLYSTQWNEILNITSTNKYCSYTGNVTHTSKGIKTIEKLRFNSKK